MAIYSRMALLKLDSPLDPKILITKQKTSNRLVLPGGRMKNQRNEDSLDALLRELKEEMPQLGLDDWSFLLGLYWDFTIQWGISNIDHVFVIAVLKEIEIGKSTDSDCAEFGFVPIKDILFEDYLPFDGILPNNTSQTLQAVWGEYYGEFVLNPPVEDFYLGKTQLYT